MPFHNDRVRRAHIPLATRLLHALFLIRIYRNGDTFGFLWRWWNPLSFIAAGLTFLITALAVGFPAAWQDREYCGLVMSPYFERYPDKLTWMSWSEVQSARGGWISVARDS